MLMLLRLTLNMIIFTMKRMDDDVDNDGDGDNTCCFWQWPFSQLAWIMIIAEDDVEIVIQSDNQI